MQFRLRVFVVSKKETTKNTKKSTHKICLKLFRLYAICNFKNGNHKEHKEEPHYSSIVFERLQLLSPTLSEILDLLFNSTSVMEV